MCILDYELSSFVDCRNADGEWVLETLEGHALDWSILSNYLDRPLILQLFGSGSNTSLLYSSSCIKGLAMEPCIGFSLQLCTCVLFCLWLKVPGSMHALEVLYQGNYTLDWWTMRWIKKKKALFGWLGLVDSGSYSVWRLITSALPQGSSQRSVLFHSFINDLESAKKCAVSRFAGDAKTGRATSQRDLDTLEERSAGIS